MARLNLNVVAHDQYNSLHFFNEPVTVAKAFILEETAGIFSILKCGFVVHLVIISSF